MNKSKKSKEKPVRQEKPLKLNMSFEEAVKLALNTPKPKKILK
ncbi:MAG TPA: hypothetical protein PLP23_06280 [Panacibacter sp.]|nr:hypothetical protein [Panacibacter sp.]